MKIINIISTLLLFSTTLSYANSYNALISKEHNKYVNEAPTPPVVAVELCEIEFRNIIANHYVTLGNIQINTTEGSFDLGSFTGKVGSTISNFTNMTVNVNSTYSNGTRYYPEYAQRGFEGTTNYWLPSATPARYTMIFNAPVSVESIEYTDRARSDAAARDYFIDFYDCDENIVNTVEIEGTLAVEQNEIVTVYAN